MTTQQLLVPSNATLKRNVMDYSLIVVGSFLQALSYVLFLAPYKIVPGGVYGISIVIHYVTKDLFPFFPDGLPMGATALCFNIPLMILAMKKIGLSSGPKTIVTFLLISIFTDSLSYFLTDPLVENDAFIAAFYGGYRDGIHRSIDDLTRELLRSFGCTSRRPDEHSSECGETKFPHILQAFNAFFDGCIRRWTWRLYGRRPWPG